MNTLLEMFNILTKPHKVIVLIFLLFAIVFTTAYVVSFNYENNKDISDVCTCQNKIFISNFIKTHMKSPNNMSDKEIESLVIKLTQIADKTHCKQKQLVFSFNNKYWIISVETNDCPLRNFNE